MKSNLNKAVLIISIVMVVSFSVAIAVFFATGGLSVSKIRSSRIEEYKSYEVQGIKNIEITTVSSNINVYESDAEDIEIYLSGDISTNLQDNVPELKAEIDGSELVIYIDHPKAITLGIVNFMDLELDVMIPKDFRGDLDMVSTSGKLDIKGLYLGDICTNGVSGKVMISDVRASEIEVETTSGRIFLEKIKGDLGISTISGEVSSEIEELTGDIEIDTISGAVNLEIPAGSGFFLDLESISGLISNEFGAEIKYADSDELEATVGDGKFNIKIKTTSGSIDIKENK